MPYCTSDLQWQRDLLLHSDSVCPSRVRHVKCYLRCAIPFSTADLQWQRDLLLDQARRMLVGCQEPMWYVACPAALALTRRLEVSPACPRAMCLAVGGRRTPWSKAALALTRRLEVRPALMRRVPFRVHWPYVAFAATWRMGVRLAGPARCTPRRMLVYGLGAV